MKKKTPYIQIAILLGLVLHGTTFFFTFEQTYDAYVHIFFADHYANGWFDTWEDRWYTGFTITSYPPLIHQTVGLLSKLIGLKLAFYCVSLSVIVTLIYGVYKFAGLWVSQEAAGLAAIAAVLLGSIVEAIHVFGQIPSLAGIAFLLNACPFIYLWFRKGGWLNLGLALSFLSVTTAAHHVSTIFGMVFFVLPVIGLALTDHCIEKRGSPAKLDIRFFLQSVIKWLPKALLFGFLVISLVVIILFPYWSWSSANPITQVSIPHGSRSSFIENPDLRLIFFIIPWSFLLLILPLIFQKLFVRRHFFLGVSFTLAFILGTGGTTPIPSLLLGENAFEILTLDRFTFWATIMGMPFFGLFVYSLLFGSLAKFIKQKSNILYKAYIGLLATSILLSTILVVNIGFFRPFQPDPIDIRPIVNFLDRDKHDEWRYLTLGFGDQMAWLSANSDAQTVDGNYHSARSLPELTTRAVERLENAKYQGEEGLSALKDFLYNPETYHLKFIFCNDKFYEPVLYFAGWNKVGKLENNIDLWQRVDIPPINRFVSKAEIPFYQRIMWGIIPISSLLFLFFMTIFYAWKKRGATSLFLNNLPFKSEDKISFKAGHVVWSIGILFGVLLLMLNNYGINKSQINPENLIVKYYDHLDFKRFEKAYLLLNPETRPSLDAYLLEISLEDGIQASYAKLKGIEFVQVENETNEASIKIRTNWVSSFKEFDLQESLEATKVGKKWFLEYEPYSKETPPDQFITLPGLDFHNMGRRKATIETTNRADVLDRPELAFLDVNLVAKDSNYHLVGHLINISNRPAQAFVQSRFKNEDGHWAKASAKDICVHHLLPKELTGFRIDLENFILGTEIEILATSSVSASNIYKYTGIKDVELNESNKIEASYLNYGTSEISIPQVLINYEDEILGPLWIDNHYLQKGIRAQRKKDFSVDLIKRESITIVMSLPEKGKSINGVPNEEMTDKLRDDLNVYKKPYLLKNESIGINFFMNGFIYE